MFDKMVWLDRRKKTLGAACDILFIVSTLEGGMFGKEWPSGLSSSVRQDGFENERLLSLYANSLA